MMSPVPYFMLANKEARKSNQQNLDLAVKSNDKTKDQPTPTKNGNAVGQNVEPDKNITTPQSLQVIFMTLVHALVKNVSQNF